MTRKFVKRSNFFIPAFRNKLRELCQDVLPQMKGTWWYRQSREEIGSLIDRIWCFGPDKARSNILINCVPDYDRGSIWKKSTEALRPFDNSIISGFQLFVGSGPLCNEAMRGVVVLLEGWSVDETVCFCLFFDGKVFRMWR